MGGISCDSQSTCETARHMTVERAWRNRKAFVRGKWPAVMFAQRPHVLFLEVLLVSCDALARQTTYGTQRDTLQPRKQQNPQKSVSYEACCLEKGDVKPPPWKFQTSSPLTPCVHWCESVVCTFASGISFVAVSTVYCFTWQDVGVGRLLGFRSGVRMCRFICVSNMKSLCCSFLWAEAWTSVALMCPFHAQWDLVFQLRLTLQEQKQR